MPAHKLVLLSIGVALLSSMSPARAQERPASPFNRTILVGRAEELAKQNFVEPARATGNNAPAKLTFEQYRAIHFQKGASI